MQETEETWIPSLGWEDPLEKEMATHSRILAWKIPWTEEPGGLESLGSHRQIPLSRRKHRLALIIIDELPEVIFYTKWEIIHLILKPIHYR